MKKLAVLSMAAVLAAGCLVGCGSKDSSGSKSKYAGKYEAAKVVSGDTEFTTDYSGNPIATFLQFELKDDGKAIGWDAKSQKEEADIGKWTVDGDEIKLTDDSEDNSGDNSDSDSNTMTIKIDGDDFIMSEGGSKIYLKKVSEYTTLAAAESTEASED